jgi:hypothetical protein
LEASLKPSKTSSTFTISTSNKIILEKNIII